MRERPTHIWTERCTKDAIDVSVNSSSHVICEIINYFVRISYHFCQKIKGLTFATVVSLKMSKLHNFQVGTEFSLDDDRGLLSPLYGFTLLVLIVKEADSCQSQNNNRGFFLVDIVVFWRYLWYGPTRQFLFNTIMLRLSSSPTKQSKCCGTAWQVIHHRHKICSSEWLLISVVCHEQQCVIWKVVVFWTTTVCYFKRC